MQDGQLLPFERNRYYMGKLLTSDDFLAEQTYHNNKRRFINRIMYGAGVVYGLNVFNLDDHSIMIESGVAVDGYGREIVLENSEVKKLSTIDGFEEIEDSEVYLCLSYEEEPIHPVYSIARQASEDSYEQNRIREGWRLFLAGAGSLAKSGAQETEFLITSVLYTDSDFTISVSMPSAVSAGNQAKLVVSIEKNSFREATLNLRCTLQTPAFLSADGTHEIQVEVTDLALECSQSHVMEYWLRAQPVDSGESLIVIKNNFSDLAIQGEAARIVDNFMIKVAVAQMSPEELVQREVSKISLETRVINGFDDYITLAKLHVQRSKNTYIIEMLDDHTCRQYIRTPESEDLRKRYLSYFGTDGLSGTSRAAEDTGGVGASFHLNEPVYATGVCEIPLSYGIRKGDIEYSGEIMHGLGKGNVYVSVGTEYLDDDPRLGSKARNTIFGDAGLFVNDNPPLSIVQSAVKVMNDRGSFIVAAKLLKETNYVLLTLRWVAIKLPTGGDQALVRRISGKSIAAAQPTVVMATRESHYFDVLFKNMEPCPLLYSLTEENSGEITPDGIYTAPAREGVYEIRISCEDMPMILTYAYAVVKKRGAESDKEQ